MWLEKKRLIVFVCIVVDIVINRRFIFLEAFADDHCDVRDFDALLHAFNSKI